MTNDDKGYKWWIRYVVVPLFGGGGIVALVVAFFNHNAVKPIPEADPYKNYVEHSYPIGQVPNGYACKLDSDCLPSPDKGYCYPGPPNNEVRYCQDKESNCAFPGSPGVSYNKEISYLNHIYICPRPDSGQARWRAVR